MKKVAFIINSLTNGGAERVVSRLITNLDDSYDTSLILNKRSNDDYETCGKVYNLNINTKSNIFEFVFLFFSMIKRYFKIKKIKKNSKFDIAISFLESSNVINYLTRVKNEKVVVSVRSYLSLSPKKNGFIVKKIIKYVYNRVDLVVAVSNVIRDDLINNYKINADKIKVIYNPYDIQSINTMMNENNDSVDSFISEQCPLFVNTGRLTTQKGHKFLIDAFSEVVRHNSKAVLMIFGEGPLREKLYTQIENLKLCNNVKLMGFLENPFIYYKYANAFILSSLFEGFPNALSEAMACGLSIISSDCKSGPREILYPDSNYYDDILKITYADYGILVPDFASQSSQISINDKVKMLSKAIIDIMNNPDISHKYGILAKERVHCFNMDLIISQWEEIIYSD